MSIAVPSPQSPLGQAAPGPGAESLVALLVARVESAGDRIALVDGLTRGHGAERDGGRGAAGWTWAELAAAALDLADRLEAAGFVRGDRVAHRGGPGPDWIVVDLACLLAGLVHVAVHDEPGSEPAADSLDWLGLRGGVASGGRRPPRLPGPSVDAAGALAGHRGRAGDHAAVLRRLERRLADCDPDAPCTILLSSGTTGLPHGVLHTQRGLAANAVAASATFLDDPRDVRLAWLPMSHALARTGDLYTAIVRGGCLNVVRDRSRVLDACAALPPTVILGVPAFFERLEGGARAGRIADLRAALGGEVRVCVSGGAQLRRRTAECFAAAGVPLVEGY
ncbi:MAG: AMP-binding protein, partial [Planctomycetia bacterium]